MLTILEFPDARLRKKAQRIETVTGSTADLADQMLSAMYEAPGIGLAATQVNVQKRLIVCDVSEGKDAPLRRTTSSYHLVLFPRPEHAIT